MFASERELNSFSNLEFYASYHTLGPGTPFLVVNNCTGTLSVGQQSWQIAGINCNWAMTWEHLYPPYHLQPNLLSVSPSLPFGVSPDMRGNVSRPFPFCDMRVADMIGCNKSDDISICMIDHIEEKQKGNSFIIFPGIYSYSYLHA